MSGPRGAVLEWLIAWRHLRVGDERPAWVTPALLGAVYLLAVGAGLAIYAAGLDPPVEVTGAAGAELAGKMASPAARAFGLLGGGTLLVGAMLLLFALLSMAFNLLASIITMSVLLGCMAMVVVLSLMSGLEEDLRSKILDQKAHIRISRKDGKPFASYLDLAEAVAAEAPVAGVSPYLEGEIMLRSGLQRQAAILTGILPDWQTRVSNLPEIVVEGDYRYLTAPEEIPAEDPFATPDQTPWRLRHLEKTRKEAARRAKEAREEAATRKGQRPLGGGTAGADEGETDTAAGGGGEHAPAEAPAPPAEAAARAGALNLPPPPPLPEDRPLPAMDDGWEDPSALARGEARASPEPAPPEAPAPSGLAAATGRVGAALEGEFDEKGSGSLAPLLIGRELQMELGVGVGARIQLITPVGRLTPAGRVPGVMSARIGGVFYSGMYEYDRKNVYAPLPVVQAFLRAGDRVSGIEVKLHDVDAIDAGKAAVEAAVARMGLADELRVEDWRDLNRNLFSAMFLEKVAMFIALLFVVLVASFGILASNLMSVMEKSKDIAILKAMGSSERQILHVFTAEGLVVGLLGSMAGISVGLAICWALDRFGLPLSQAVLYTEDLPVVVQPVEVALVGVSALVIVWASSLYPAWVASRMHPVDGLRQADR